MVYIPIVTTPPAPSPRARELSDAVARLVEEFEHRFPDTSPADIRQALQLASQKTAGSAVPALAVTVGLGLFALLAGVAFFVYRNSGGGGTAGRPIMLMAVIGIAVIAIGVFAIMAAKRR